MLQALLHVLNLVIGVFCDLCDFDPLLLLNLAKVFLLAALVLNLLLFELVGDHFKPLLHELIDGSHGPAAETATGVVVI